jgi:hypothetical protein
MTRALAFVLFAGCGHLSNAPPGECNGGSGCGGDLVCTRDNQCLPPDEVRAVHITWTVRGAPASVTSCVTDPDLRIDFVSRSGPRFGFEPVPCVQGKFTVDVLATDYDTVLLGRPFDKAPEQATIDAAGNAMLNLPY